MLGKAAVSVQLHVCFEVKQKRWTLGGINVEAVILRAGKTLGLMGIRRSLAAVLQHSNEKPSFQFNHSNKD